MRLIILDEFWIRALSDSVILPVLSRDCETCVTAEKILSLSSSVDISKEKNITEWPDIPAWTADCTAKIDFPTPVLAPTVINCSSHQPEVSSFNVFRGVGIPGNPFPRSSDALYAQQTKVGLHRIKKHAKRCHRGAFHSTQNLTDLRHCLQPQNTPTRISISVLTVSKNLLNL